jgi:hypothetical protein
MTHGIMKKTMTHSNMLRNQQIIKEERPAPSKPPKPTTNTPTQLPSWVPSCLKKISNIIPTSSPRQVREVLNDQINYFFENGNFQITDKNIKLVHKGTWECQGDDYIIKTDDGDTYDSKTGKWSGVPQSQNTGDSGTSGTSGSGTTTKKRGTPLNAQDYEGINFNYRYPGDKNYRYGVKANEWYAKNITNNRVFNISKDGFTSSVNYLNAQFPDAFKEVTQQTTPPVTQQDTTTKTPAPVTQQDTTKTTTPPAVAQDSTSGSKYLIDKPFEI